MTTLLLLSRLFVLAFPSPVSDHPFPALASFFPFAFVALLCYFLGSLFSLLSFRYSKPPRSLSDIFSFSFTLLGGSFAACLFSLLASLPGTLLAFLLLRPFFRSPSTLPLPLLLLPAFLEGVCVFLFWRFLWPSIRD